MINSFIIEIKSTSYLHITILIRQTPFVINIFRNYLEALIQTFINLQIKNKQIQILELDIYKSTVNIIY